MKKTKSGHKNYASLLLRIGLGLVFAYAAIASFRHPHEWVGYLPSFLVKSDQALTWLKFFTLFEVILAAWLLIGKYIKYAAIVTAVSLIGIMIANPKIIDVTFRDIGLIFAALALLALNWDKD